MAELPEGMIAKKNLAPEVYNHYDHSAVCGHYKSVDSSQNIVYVFILFIYN